MLMQNEVRQTRRKRSQTRLALIRICGSIGAGAMLSVSFHQAMATSDAIQFDVGIRTVLSDKCFACHGPDEGQRKTALRLDTKEGAFGRLKSGGYAIVPGDLERSELYQRISSGDPARRMPPSYLGHDKLSAAEIDRIRRWIEQGAKWQSHWAFVLPQRPGRPKVENHKWPRNDIDYFVLQRLEQEGLKPSPEAGRPTLIRRLTLDLTGLPPMPQEVRNFLSDTSDEAYEKVIDRLLASNRYGERMAIRWLDASRYADTNGYQTDGIRDMYRWRDWVIDAFNSNKPFDEFTVEQIAGDMLPGATRDQIIATGFNRNHRATAEGGIIDEEFRIEYVADRVETTSTVWLGLTVGCARCHDHKYDPITQKEFYQFFAYFNNVPERGLYNNFGNTAPLIKAPTPKHEARLAGLDKELAEAKENYRRLGPKLVKAQRAWESWIQSSETADWLPRRELALHFPLDGTTEEATGAYEPNVARNPLEPPPEPSVPQLVSSEPGAQPFVDGEDGRGVALDGKRYIDGGDGFVRHFEDAFSFSAWIYPTVPTGAILSRTEDFPKGAGHGLYLRDGKVFGHITTRWEDMSVRVRTRQSIELNQWHHVALTYEGKRKAKYLHSYVNGEEWETEVLFDELFFPFLADMEDPFRIGGGGGPENRFRGSIHDARAYYRALTPAEVAVLTVEDTVPEIAAMPPSGRSKAQADKLEFAFVGTAAPDSIQQAKERWRRADRERTKFFESIPTVMVMAESDPPRQTHLLTRGSYDLPGEKVGAGVPAVLGRIPEGYPNNRLGLARWLVDRSNPLTARVTVNRFWQGLFQTGLVKTPENFGSQGERPSNQELLDWLAVEFMDEGWNAKALLKTIVMSATYRQSSKVRPELLERDPDNLLLARGPRFRLPAEVIRDQALAVSGLLVEQIGGPSVKPYQPPGLWKELLFRNMGYEPDEGDKLYRRSLYTFWRRTLAPPSMVNFDSTDREMCTVRQKITNTPLQALNLMNDVTFVEASRKMAERMMSEGGDTPKDRIAYGFELVTARMPEPDESEPLEALYRKFLGNFRADTDAAVQLLGQGSLPRDPSLDEAEVASYATVASLILNLDETVTKE